MIQKIRKKLNAFQEYKKTLRKTNMPKYILVELLDTVGVALILALIIRHFLFQTSLVFSGSMIPTMQIDDRLIVNKLVYSFRAPIRGEIILFESPYDDGKEYVKRLIAMPGETVELKRGTVYINGKQLVLPGINIRRDYANIPPKQVPDGSYFVLGDNRGNSADSRVWGYVSRDELIGKALFTFWPIDRIQVLR